MDALHLFPMDGTALLMDAVLVRVSPGMLRDYAERGVFNELMPGCAVWLSTSGRTYATDDAGAGRLLSDARDRLAAGAKGRLKAALSQACHVWRDGLREMRIRQTVAANAQAVQLKAGPWADTWLGTKTQLQDVLGFVRTEAWPGEGSPPRRWVRVIDRRGWAVSLKRYHACWPALFLAEVHSPVAERAATAWLDGRAPMPSAAGARLETSARSPSSPCRVAAGTSAAGSRVIVGPWPASTRMAGVSR